MTNDVWAPISKDFAIKAETWLENLAPASRRDEDKLKSLKSELKKFSFNSWRKVIKSLNKNMLEKFQTTISDWETSSLPVCLRMKGKSFLSHDNLRKNHLSQQFFISSPQAQVTQKQQQQTFTTMSRCWWQTCVLLTWQSPNTRYSSDSCENLFSVIRTKGGVIHHQRAGIRNKEAWSSQIPPWNLLFVALQHMWKFATTDSKLKDEGCLAELFDSRRRKGKFGLKLMFLTETHCVCCYFLIREGKKILVMWKKD